MVRNIAAIQTNQLTKQFPKRERLLGLLPPRDLDEPAVDGVSIQVPAGELFGLLGPNGAGKTTLIKMLATLVAPTSGTASVLGFDLSAGAAVRQVVGLVTTDERSFYWRLTGRQNLAFFGDLHSLPDTTTRVQEMLELVGLQESADTAFKAYSTGMRQRLAIARSLLHRPSVLLLDEPTRGLDPPAVRSLHTLIREELANRQGLTVLMTTHWLQEAEMLCDRLAVLHKGRLRGVGTVAELRSLVGGRRRYRLRAHTTTGATADWPQGVEQDGEGGWWIPGDPALVDATVDAARAAGMHIETLSQERIDLEEVFDRLTEGAGSERNPTLDIPSQENDHIPQRSLRNRQTPSFLGTAAAFLRRDWQAERSYRFAFLLSLGGILFSAAVFFYVARLVDAAAIPYIETYQGGYFAFVLIGIALQRYFGVGLSGFSRSFRQAQTTGTLEAMLTTPAPLWQIVFGASLWSYSLVTLQVLVYLLVGVTFLGLDLQVNLPAAVLSAALSIVSFAALGILSAAFVMVLKRGDPITWAVGAISTFFGGVYFPVEVLPVWLQPVSALLPLTYGLRAVRASLLQAAGVRDIGGDLLALAIFCIVLIPLGIGAFRYAVQRAREDGSLTHY